MRVHPPLIFVILLLFCFLNGAYAQSSKLTQNVVSTMMDYRKKVFPLPAKESERLDRLLGFMVADETDTLGTIRLLRNVAMNIHLDGYEADFILEDLRQQFEWSKLDSLQPAQLELLARHLYLLELMAENHLSWKYPYTLRANPGFYRELDFLGVLDGENVAVISSPTGFWTSLLAQLYPKTRVSNVYISAYFGARIHRRSLDLVGLLPGINSFTYRSWPQNHRPESLNRVIMFETAPDIPNPKNPLRRAKPLLRKVGTLLIRQTPTEDLSIAEVRAAAVKLGFVFVEQLSAGEYYWLKFLR